MTITAPVSGLSLATLARLVSLPLPDGAPSSSQEPRSPDVVVFSSAPLRMLSDLASAGLQRLTTLLPALEQAVQEDSAAPIGHLAKAAGAAARQIGEGHVALLAEGPERVAASLRGDNPAPPVVLPTDTRQALRTLARQVGVAAEAEPPRDERTGETLRAVARQIGMAERSPSPRLADPEATPIQRWITEAKLVLRGTSEVLERAEQQLTARQAQAPDAPDVPPRDVSTRDALTRDALTTESLITDALARDEPTPSALIVDPRTADAPGQVAPTSWALAQIAAAQAQVTAAYGSLGRSLPAPRRAAAIAPGSFKLPVDHLAGATTMFGTLLVLAILWLAGGIWSVVTGAVGLVGVGLWLMRIGRASRGISLDARR